MNGQICLATMLNKIIVIFSLFVLCSCTNPSNSTSLNFQNASTKNNNTSSLVSSNTSSCVTSTTSISDISKNEDLSSDNSSCDDKNSSQNGGLHNGGANTDSQFGEPERPSIVF